DDSYYEEWFEDVEDIDNFQQSGWIAGVNFPEHIIDEQKNYNIDSYINFGGVLQFPKWRTMPPQLFFQKINEVIMYRLGG
ncbi:MAG: hypothetical protein AAGA64_16715, partial [Bacteroidota bacterium]